MWWPGVLIGLLVGGFISTIGACAFMSTRQALTRKRLEHRQDQLGYQFLKIETLTTRLELQIKSFGRDFGLGLMIRFGETDPWEHIHSSLGVIKENLDLSAEQISLMRARVRKELDSFTPDHEDTKTL